jgi:mono/diheme cytochrome c family protein
MRRLVAAGLWSAFFFVFVAAPLTAAEVAALPKLQALVAEHCVGCHDVATKESNLDLEQLPLALDDAEVAAKWVRVHDRIASGEMPPASEKPPKKLDREAAVKELAQALTAADQKRRAERGRSLFRRLTRAEYENTLRDLFDLPMLNVRELLPDDGRVDGYDKVGEGLDLSSVQMAKYMEAADVALDMAIALSPERPEYYIGRHYPASQGAINTVLFNGDAIFLKDKKYDDYFVPIVREQPQREVVAKIRGGKELRAYTGGVGIFRHEDDAFLPKFTTFAPHFPGRYRLRISLWSFNWNKGEVQPATKMHTLSLMTGGRLIGNFDAPSIDSQVHEVEVWLNRGDLISFNAASLWPVRVSETGGRAAEYVGPGVAIDWLDVEGPLLADWPPPSHRRLFGDLPLAALPKTSPTAPPRRTVYKGRPGAFPRTKLSQQIWTTASIHPLHDAERLLADFLPRAFRRPVEPAEVARYVTLVRERIDSGHCFETAMRLAYKTALCSPDFLYLRETPGALDEYAVASRLSYFLWNSLPDDTLTSLAAAKKLRSPNTLKAEVARLLADPKSDRFVNDFLDQWLSLREIDFTMPDRKLYPEFRPHLQQSMLGESRAYFRELLESDAAATAVIDGDFALLNQRMCEHYGLFTNPVSAAARGTGAAVTPLVVGSQFRRVPLPANSGRGGFLTHASVLKVTANGTSTSPVKRGAWVLTKILGEPPQPPPPDVPAVEPDVRGATTIREQLAKHRSDKVCASCHMRIDPPGFALESYDVIGGLRDRYRGTDEGDAPDIATAKAVLGARNLGYKLGRPVECAGETVDGTKFADLAQFKQLLLCDPAKIAENVAKQMLTYSTGSAVGFADRPALSQIIKKTETKNYGLRSLLAECVISSLFLSK